MMNKQLSQGIKTLQKINKGGNTKPKIPKATNKQPTERKKSKQSFQIPIKKPPLQTKKNTSIRPSFDKGSVMKLSQKGSRQVPRVSSMKFESSRQCNRSNSKRVSNLNSQANTPKQKQTVKKSTSKNRKGCVIQTGRKTISDMSTVLASAKSRKYKNEETQADSMLYSPLKGSQQSSYHRNTRNEMSSQGEEMSMIMESESSLPKQRTKDEKLVLELEASITDPKLKQSIRAASKSKKSRVMSSREKLDIKKGQYFIGSNSKLTRDSA